MPIDGVVVRNIIVELNSKILYGRIDKITQPEDDEIIMTVRNAGINYKLLLSSSANYPRVHLTDVNKQSPINAPLFCMVLRKHIQGGKIVKIEQHKLDRIIKIYIENYDELGILSNKILFCEIMGRHSNIVLVQENNNTIIDSIKHITPSMSSFRQILPGLEYSYPPMQDKMNPLHFNVHELENRIMEAPGEMKLEKFISSNIDGISIFAAREICFNAGLNDDSRIRDLHEYQKDKLLKSAMLFINNIVSNNFRPCLYYNGTVLYDLYCFNLEYLKHMTVEEKDSISETIEQFFYKKDKFDRLKQKSADIIKIINNNLDRCYKKLAIQQEKLSECSQRDKWKLFGDLIMANLYYLKKGDAKALVTNFYDEELNNIEIPLDITLTPAENAQKYYKKYNKDKNAQLIVEKQKEDNLQEIEYLENQLVNINNCTEDDEIEEIRTELISMGYIKKGRKTASKKIKQSKPLHFISSEGIDIYVGKNNIQNDYLTMKFAEPYDIWLHTKNIPGSHVIIKAPSKHVDDTTIFEAAQLSAYYSKARNSSNVPVDYTEKKNVKKPSGARPGMVVYYTNKTLFVTPDEEFINKIERVL